MATIYASDLAPAEEVHYSLAGGEEGEFDLDAGGSHETDNDEVIRNAGAHPWLRVEVPVVEQTDDATVLHVDFPKTAIEAGLDQKVEDFVGEDDNIAETLAADDAQEDVVVTEPDEPVVEPETEE